MEGFVWLTEVLWPGCCAIGGDDGAFGNRLFHPHYGSEERMTKSSSTIYSFIVQKHIGTRNLLSKIPPHIILILPPIVYARNTLDPFSIQGLLMIPNQMDHPRTIRTPQ